MEYTECNGTLTIFSVVPNTQYTICARPGSITFLNQEVQLPSITQQSQCGNQCNPTPTPTGTPTPTPTPTPSEIQQGPGE